MMYSGSTAGPWIWLHIHWLFWGIAIFGFVAALLWLYKHANKKDFLNVAWISLVVGILGGLLTASVAMVGWNQITNQSEFWKKKSGWLSNSWKFFWVLNGFLLLFFTTTYSKRSRVEAMNYLYEKGDFNGMIIERSHRDDCYLMPRYYLNNWDLPIYCVNQSYSDESLSEALVQWKKNDVNYLLIVEEKDLEMRKQRILNHLPDATFETIIEPSFMDKVLHWLNPYNQNERVYVYKIEG